MKKRKDINGSDRKGKERKGNDGKEKEKKRKEEKEKQSRIQHGGTRVITMKSKMTNVSYHNFFKSCITELSLAHLWPII